MVDQPTVTLCIPTFQRSGCLAELLESVAAQSPGFSEVVISDDCSQDDTRIIVDGFRDRIPSLIYHRCVKNVGLDENFRIVVSLARSEYVWLMGDDDRLRPGAVSAFYEALDNFPGVLGMTFASIDYDATLSEPTGLKQFPDTRVITGVETLFSNYIDVLGFMSTTVVDRASWESVSAREVGRFDNLYSQVHRIGVMLGPNGQWLICKELTVDYRSDNDQFKAASGGDLPRLMKDVSAYRSIIFDLVGSGTTASRSSMDRVLRTHIISRVRNAKLRSGFPWAAALNALTAVYSRYPYYWLIIVPTLVLPSATIRTLRTLFKRYHPSSGASRVRDLATGP